MVSLKEISKHEPMFVSLCHPRPMAAFVDSFFPLFGLNFSGTATMIDP